MFPRYRQNPYRNRPNPYRPNINDPSRTPKEYWSLFTVSDFGLPVFPTTFIAGYDETPLDIIRPLEVSQFYGTRLVHRDRPWWAFVLVDGACTNNGRLGAQGGWSVVYGPPIAGSGPQQVVSGRLEERGPFGDKFAPTSNRAELRASIAALRLCNWRREGTKRLVIATDSSYVVEGATSWSRAWTFTGWRTAGGAPVQNRDLWEVLLGQVSYWASQGLLVLFWKIPRELNQEADSAAKAASLYGFREPQFVDWVIRNPDPPSSSSVAEMVPLKPWKRVVVLCPKSKALVDYRYKPLLSRIRPHAYTYSVELGQTIKEARHLLKEGPRPSIILITDNSICRHSSLVDLVRQRLRQGSIVVLTGDFGVSADHHVDRFFGKLDLYLFWGIGDTVHGTDEECLRHLSNYPRLRSMLPEAHTPWGVSLLDVPSSSMVYNGRSRKTTTAFAPVNRGYLCFVGDETRSSEDIILAMCCGLFKGEECDTSSEEEESDSSTSSD